LRFLINAALAGSASAHVKWFCAFNVAGQPEGLEKVLCPNFDRLIGVSIFTLLAGAVLESTPISAVMLSIYDRATYYLRDNIEAIFRASVAFYFISIWAVGGILLTPELKSSSNVIGAIQLGIAAGMMSRRDDAVIGRGHFHVVRGSRLAVRHLSPRRLSGLSRRRRVSRID
jgi:hypothetical protein